MKSLVILLGDGENVIKKQYKGPYIRYAGEGSEGFYRGHEMF